MDTNTLIDLIQTVTKTLNKDGFEHISITHEGSTVTLNKKSISPQPPVVGGPAYTMGQQTNEPTGQQTTVSAEQSAASQPSALVAPTEADDSNYTTIDSPIVGTFYDAPSPEAAPFVKVGDKVKKGDVVCIIEAMKLMNEIEAECDGEIAQILISNEGPVEYGQALFKVIQG